MAKKTMVPAAAPRMPASTLMPDSSQFGEGDGRRSRVGQIDPWRDSNPTGSAAPQVAPVVRTISDILGKPSPRPGYTPGGRGKGPSAFGGNVPQPNIPTDIDCSR